MAKSLTSRVVLAVGWHGWHKSPLVAASAVTAALLLLLLPLSVDVALMWSSDANSSSHLATMLGEHCGGPPMLSAHDSDALDLSQCSAKGEAFSASADRLGLSSLQAGPQTANGGRLCAHLEEKKRLMRLAARQQQPWLWPWSFRGRGLSAVAGNGGAGAAAGGSGSSTGGGGALAGSPSFAYVTLITGKKLVASAIVFAQALRATRTPHHLVLMIADGGEMSTVPPQLHLFFDAVIRVDWIPNPYKAIYFTKFHIWRMVEFAKVVYLDVDTLPLANVDHLFERPEITGAPGFFLVNQFNAGIMVVKPSLATYDALLRTIDVIGSVDRGDQGFLNAVFSNFANQTAAHRLDYRYNAMLSYPDQYPPPPWYDAENAHETLGPLMILHYGGPWGKPAGFGEIKPVSGPNGCTHRCWVKGRQPVTRWLAMWHDLSQALFENCWRPLERGKAEEVLVNGLPNKGDYEWVRVAGHSTGLLGEEAQRRNAQGGEKGEGEGEGERIGERNGEEKGAKVQAVVEVQLASMWSRPALAAGIDVGVVDEEMDAAAAAAAEGAEGAADSVDGAAGDGGAAAAAAAAAEVAARRARKMVFATVVGPGNVEHAYAWAMSYDKYHDPSQLQQQQQAQRRQIIESSSSSGGGSSMAAQQLDDLLLLTRHDTLVLALSSVPKPSLANLRRLFTHVRVVDPISVREGRGMRELLEEFAVLHLWNQTDFQRIVYVDPLSLFKDNCNHMFGVFRPFAAPPLRFPPDLFSTRVMLIQPQSATLHHMVSAIESAPLRPLQTAYLDLFLNAYYGTWYRESTLHRMPYEYGLNLWMRQRLHQYYPHPRIVNFDGQSPLDTEDLDNWRDFDKRKGNMGQEWLDLRRAALALLEK
ncbi:hypothetical protein CLOP_g23831 [Closterium sp. NIES-67]|nr:hypothetical protein CLOP_g23831 [Closterium sp. NIES-67]